MHPMRKKERETSEEEAYRILNACEYAVLCTINADDGKPYGVPISFTVEGSTVYLHMALAGQKLENIRNNPEVCITFVGDTLVYPEQYTTDFESVIITGKAEFVVDRDEKIQVLRLICAKYGPKESSEFLEKKIAGGIDRMEIIKVPIERITGKARWRKPKTSSQE